MREDRKRYAGHATVEEATNAMLAELLPIVEGVDVMRNRVLVAAYHRPEKTAGGIIRPDANLDEEKWQGKAGLILKVGPAAFQFDEVVHDMEHYGVTAEDAHVAHKIPTVGQWVYYRNSDAFDTCLRVEMGVGVLVRIIDDGCIIGRVADPDMIW